MVFGGMDEDDAELEAVFNFAELVGDQLLPPVLPVAASPEEDEDSVAPVRPLIAEQVGGEVVYGAMPATRAHPAD